MKLYFYSGCIAAIGIAALPGAASAQSASSGNAFNPALSVILDGKYAHYSRDPADYGISGFLLGGEAGLTPKGLSLGETEIAASANVDDRFFAQTTIALASDGDKTDIGVEEAFFQTTALPDGFTLQFGRFFSEIGYLNSKHAHAWDFVDQPLAYKAMLNKQYGDDGVQARFVAPTDLLIEVGAEAFRGAQFPAAGAARGGVGSWTAFAHTGGDVSNASSWRAGVSYLNADAAERDSTIQNGDTLSFTGSDRIWIADFVWKWAENGNPRQRNFILQGEYLHRQERGDVIDAQINYAAMAFAPDFNYSGTQQGFYLQAVYQFIPRWRAGLRFDRLSADNRGPSLGIATPLNDTSHDPSRMTAMIDFSNSEFSRLRMQLAEDKSRPQSDTQFMFQYIMSIGAHGAHQF